MDKKKVGILTMHRIPNYGSFLQTFATQKVLEDMGTYPEIIDYKFPNDWQYNRGAIHFNENVIKIKLFLARLFLLMFHSCYGNARIGKLVREFKLKEALRKYCHLSSKKYHSYRSLRNSPPTYDIYMTGSDQTLNPKHTYGDDNFLLAFAPESSYKIAFSASMANCCIDKCYVDTYKKYLSRYQKIAIREERQLEIVKLLSGNEQVCVTLDPTLLLTPLEWSCVFKRNELSVKIPSEDYIVFYMLSYSFDPQPYIYELLRYIQIKTGKLVLSFTAIEEKYDIRYRYVGYANVRDFIEIFSNATEVVTSSFHGTAFALNFGVKLYSVVPVDYKEKDSRQADLLEKVSADEYIIPVGTRFETISINTSEYKKEQIGKKLSELRKNSLLWLENAICQS